jgi:hypothetical protein
MSVVEVVQRQFEAYNDHDLGRFVATYSDTVKIFRLPSLVPSISGKAQLAEFYSTNRFNVPTLRAELVNRIVLGNKVVDHERVSGLHADTVEVIAVYEVGRDLIERVWFFSSD